MDHFDVAYEIAVHAESPLAVRTNIGLFLGVAPHVEEEPTLAVDHEVALAFLRMIFTTEQIPLFFISDARVVKLAQKVHDVICASRVWSVLHFLGEVPLRVVLPGALRHLELRVDLMECHELRGENLAAVFVLQIEHLL